MASKQEKLAKIKNAEVETPVAKDIDENVVSEETSEAPKEVKESVEKKIAKNSKSVVFKLKSGQIREFTEEIHGKDYKEIAEAFKNNGKKLVLEVL